MLYKETFQFKYSNLCGNFTSGVASQQLPGEQEHLPKKTSSGWKRKGIRGSWFHQQHHMPLLPQKDAAESPTGTASFPSSKPLSGLKLKSLWLQVTKSEG